MCYQGTKVIICKAIFNWKLVNSFFVLFIILPFIANNCIAQEYSLTKIQSLFSSSDYNNRILAAISMKNNTEIDSLLAINILINELDQEIKNPLSTDLAPHTYTTITAFLKINYALILEEYGMIAEEYIEGLIDSTSGELRDRLIIVLGKLGNTSVYNEIRNIFKNSQDDFTRLSALYAMINFADSSDVSSLIENLADDFSVSSKYVYSVGNDSLYYPIRSVAASILKKMNYSIKRDNNEYIFLGKNQ